MCMKIKKKRRGVGGRCSVSGIDEHTEKAPPPPLSVHLCSFYAFLETSRNNYYPMIAPADLARYYA